MKKSNKKISYIVHYNNTSISVMVVVGKGASFFSMVTNTIVLHWSTHKLADIIYQKIKALSFKLTCKLNVIKHIMEDFVLYILLCYRCLSAISEGPRKRRQTKRGKEECKHGTMPAAGNVQPKKLTCQGQFDDGCITLLPLCAIHTCIPEVHYPSMVN